MKSNLSFISPSSAKVIVNENSTIKRLITQLNLILQRDKDLLNNENNQTIIDSLLVLEELIAKKKSILNNYKKENERINSAKIRLEKLFNQLEDRQKLSYVLLANINAFSLCTENLNEVYEDFLDDGANIMIKEKVSAENYFKMLDTSLKNALPEKYEFYRAKLQEKINEYIEI